MIQVSVDFGYDVHAISITEAIWVQIQTGKPVTAQGQGFPVEGVIERDRWAFNHGAEGAVQVFTDEGREVFEGHLSYPEVAVRRES